MCHSKEEWDRVLITELRIVPHITVKMDQYSDDDIINCSSV